MEYFYHSRRSGFATQGLAVAVALLFTFIPIRAQNARVQFIHASPYPEVAALDVYINNVLYLDNLAFKGANAFSDLPSSEMLTIDFVNASDLDNSVPVYSKQVLLLNNRNYVMALVGDPLNRESEPPMKLSIRLDAPEFSPNTLEAEIYDLMAIPDAEYSYWGHESSNIPWLQHGEFQLGTTVVFPIVYVSRIRLRSIGIIGQVSVDFVDYKGLGVVAICSGFLESDPPARPPVSCFFVGSDGNVTEFETEIYKNARIQFINASPYAEVTKFDISVDGEIWVNDLQFTEGTAFLDIIEGSHTFWIKDADDELVFYANRNLVIEKGSFNVLVVIGDPLEREGEDPFEVLFLNDAQITGETAEPFQVRSLNAIANVPEIQILVNSQDLWGTLSYGEFASDYKVTSIGDALISTMWPNKGLLNYTRHTGSDYSLGSVAIGIFSGLVDPPEGGPSRIVQFQVHPDGSTTVSPVVAADVQFINGSPFAGAEKIDIYYGPLRLADDLEFRSGTAFVPVFTGIRRLSIVPADSSNGDYPWTKPYINTLDGRKYAAVVAGSPEELPGMPGMNLHAKVVGHLFADNPNTMEIMDVNVVPDATTLRLDETEAGVGLIAELPYGGFDADHQVFEDNPGEYTLYGVFSETDSTGFDFHVADYWLGEAAILLHSGFLHPTGNQPPYAATLIRNDGSIHPNLLTPNERDNQLLPDRFALKGNYPNPFNPVTTVVFDLPESATVTLQLFDILGRNVRSIEAGIVAAGTNQSIRVDGSGLASGLYIYRVLAHTTRGIQMKTGQMSLVQ